MKENMDELKAATVHCNTPELLFKALSSIRKFYSVFDLPICVLNNSTNRYTKGIKYHLLNVDDVYMGGNIGHGPAMDWAIHNLNAEYLLLFDTDIVMKKPCLEKMLAMFDEDTFGVGEVNLENQSVYNIKFGKKKIPILHPYFHIVQTKVYRQYLPYVQNGGPCFLTALDIFSQRKSHILKNFPVKDYVDHRHKGTRDVKPPDMFKDSVVLNDKYIKRFEENWRGK